MVRELNPDKRELFLQTALRLFASKGLKDTSTADITREAGTAAGTLFLYFPTKQHLINELALQISHDEASRVNMRLEPDMPARDMFFVIWNESILWLIDHPQAFIFSQQIRDPGILPENVVLETGKNFAFYYEAIYKGFRENSIKPLPADLIGGFLYHDIVAAVTYLNQIKNLMEKETIIQQTFDIFWSGICQSEQV